MNTATIESALGIVASNTSISVNPLSVRLTASFTRPNDTSAYASGDWMSTATTAGTAFVFNNIPSNPYYSNLNRSLFITSMVLMFNTGTSNDCAVGAPQLWFYGSSQTFDDNAARNETYNNFLNNNLTRFGIPAVNNYGSMCACFGVTAFSIPIKGDGNIYVGLEVANAFTPAANLQASLILKGYIN